jgi:hypothetical protein
MELWIVERKKSIEILTLTEEVLRVMINGPRGAQTCWFFCRLKKWHLFSRLDNCFYQRLNYCIYWMQRFLCYKKRLKNCPSIILAPLFNLIWPIVGISSLWQLKTKWVRNLSPVSKLHREQNLLETPSIRIHHLKAIAFSMSNDSNEIKMQDILGISSGLYSFIAYAYNWVNF